MHLHLGFDAEVCISVFRESCTIFASSHSIFINQGIREDLGIHHIVVNDWNRGVDADQNVVLVSIPSVLSRHLAPPGKHILHAYTPGTEPYQLWSGLDRRSTEYKNLKAERSEVLLLTIFEIIYFQKTTLLSIC